MSVLDTNGMALSKEVLSPDTRSFNFTAIGPDSCGELTFMLIAENGVGNSSTGVIRGAFPSCELLRLGL